MKIGELVKTYISLYFWMQNGGKLRMKLSKYQNVNESLNSKFDLSFGELPIILFFFITKYSSPSFHHFAPSGCDAKSAPYSGIAQVELIRINFIKERVNKNNAKVSEFDNLLRLSNDVKLIFAKPTAPISENCTLLLCS